MGVSASECRVVGHPVWTGRGRMGSGVVTVASTSEKTQKKLTLIIQSLADVKSKPVSG